MKLIYFMNIINSTTIEFGEVVHVKQVSFICLVGLGVASEASFFTLTVCLVLATVKVPYTGEGYRGG